MVSVPPPPGPAGEASPRRQVSRRPVRAPGRESSLGTFRPRGRGGTAAGDRPGGMSGGSRMSEGSRGTDFSPLKTRFFRWARRSTRGRSHPQRPPPRMPVPASPPFGLSAERPPRGIAEKRPNDYLHVVLVNVIYPPYQAAERFGRRKRWVSSTDRNPGAFENNLFEFPGFPPVFFPGGLRDSQSSVLPPPGFRRRRDVHEHVRGRLRQLRWRL